MTKNSSYKNIQNMYITKDSKNGSMIFENLKWLTTVETAIYLRRFTKEGNPSSGAIRTLVCRNQLRARKFLGKLYFDKKELDRLIETSELRGSCL